MPGPGSRLNASLANTPVAIQVLTKELLIDLNATNYEAYLNFATNSGRDFSDVTGLASVQQGNNQVRIRGFSGAAITRDFFLSQTRSDRFSIDRYEISRGPNSILFGIGGPGGIINTTTKRALIGSRTNELRVRVGSWDDYRGSVDVGRTIVPGKLAARVNLLWQKREGWREFDKLERTGAALAMTYRPFKGTEIRLDGEYGDVKQVVAQPWPAQERLQPWLTAGKPLSPTFGAAATGTALFFDHVFQFGITRGVQFRTGDRHARIRRQRGHIVVPFHE